MATMAKRKLKTWQIEDAARLKRIYNERKRELVLTHERIAAIAGWETQSAVSQYLNAGIPLNLSALMKFASILQVNPHEISPTLAQQIHYSGELEAQMSGLGIEAFDQSEPLNDDDYVTLPALSTELAAGDGAASDNEFGVKHLKFTREYLRSKGVDPQNARVVDIMGSSHSPVLEPGDAVAVDLANTRIIDGDMYAFRDIDMLRVKLLYRRPGGGLLLRSYNRAEYPDEELTGDQVRDRIEIKGRVFWGSRDW